jgi:D-serine deaminase-like pyridoxal phosphate-dependent protein
MARYFALMEKFPGTAFSAIVDCEDVIEAFAKAAAATGMTARLWLDVNSGMNRTGIAPGVDAIRLYRLVHDTKGLAVGGLHFYDGHIHEPDVASRTRQCDEEFGPVDSMIVELRRSGLPVPAVVAGGSPTFPIHAKRQEVELSPGTPLLWDAGYGTAYADLDFLVAAVLVGRVVSKPAAGKVCVDLGTKAVASEMPQPRIVLLGVGGYRIVGHNEEHLIIEVPDAGAYRTGDVVYGIPIHICPTVARYEAALIVEGGRCVGEWRITARDRRISV